jgi:uncharacterized iron-regulated membrane protein
VNTDDRPTAWQRWVRQPRTVWLRRTLFQVHLWSGIGLGVYIFFISVTGSVLVYRNELYEAATPEPIVSTGSGPRLTDEQLAEAATSAHPGFRIDRIVRAVDPDQAVDVWLRRGEDAIHHLFDPRSGADLGSSPPIGIWLVSTLIELHDDLLAGPTGRRVNGLGAFAVIVVAVTGLVIWWPGIDRWRRGLTVHRRVGWKRFAWDLHSMVGFWSVGFLLVSGISGLYLCVPDVVQEFADWLEPLTEENAGYRVVDSAISWLAYLHFGRINGIGIPCSGPGLCDQATKAVWAAFGLAPAVMFVTGTIMWWNRVLRPRVLRSDLECQDGTTEA